MPRAISVGSSANNFALEFKGHEPIPVFAAQSASLRFDWLRRPSGDLGEVRVETGPMRATARVPFEGPLFDQLRAELEGAADRTAFDGALLQMDHNYKLRRRIGFRGAVFTGIQWTPLDARGGKEAVSASLSWLVQAIDEKAATGEQVRMSTMLRKTPLAANFRVSGLPFSTTKASRVELPGLSLVPSDVHSEGLNRHRPDPHRYSRRLGEATLGLEFQEAAGARVWVQKMVDRGQLDLLAGHSLTVELLDAALKKVMVRFELLGCQFTGMDEPVLGQPSGDLPTCLGLRFSVDRVKMSS